MLYDSSQHQDSGTLSIHLLHSALLPIDPWTPAGTEEDSKESNFSGRWEGSLQLVSWTKPHVLVEYWRYNWRQFLFCIKRNIVRRNGAEEAPLRCENKEEDQSEEEKKY